MALPRGCSSLAFQLDPAAQKQHEDQDKRFPEASPENIPGFFLCPRTRLALLAAPPAIFKSRSVAVLRRTHRNCGTEQVLKPWRPLKALSPPGGTVPKALRVTPPTPGGSLEATSSPGTAGGAAAPALGQEESAAGAPKPPCSPRRASPKALWQPTGRQQALGPKGRADSSGENPP